MMVLCCPGAALASGLATGEPLEVPWLRLVLGLGLSAAIAFLAIMLLRQMMNRRSGLTPLLQRWLGGDKRLAEKRIHILETRKLSLQADVCLFEYNGKEYLVAINQGQIVQLDESIAAKAKPDAPAEPGP